MPRYDYLCEKCSEEKEIECSITLLDNSVIRCSNGHRMKRGISAPGFSVKGQFKASNNYGLKGDK